MRCRLSVFLLFLWLSMGLVHGEANSTAAQYFERGMNALLGTGLSHNDQTAMQLLRTSAELGYLPAQTAVAYFYDTGTIVSGSSATAAEWYRKAAQQGDRTSFWLLGRLYYTGALQQDLSQAETWLQKAADQGDPFGEYLLGRVKLDRHEYDKAATWFRKAAEQGLPQAQNRLALLLKEGRGVNQDKFEACVWLLVSFNRGYSASATNLSLLEGDLGSTRLEGAKSRARELESSVDRNIKAHGCTGWAGEFADIPAPPPPDLQKFCR